jgi:hypothetical protein
MALGRQLGIEQSLLSYSYQYLILLWENKILSFTTDLEPMSDVNSIEYDTRPYSPQQSHRTTTRRHAFHADSQFTWAPALAGDQFLEYDLKPPPCERLSTFKVIGLGC